MEPGRGHTNKKQFSVLKIHTPKKSAWNGEDAIGIVAGRGTEFLASTITPKSARMTDAAVKAVIAMSASSSVLLSTFYFLKCECVWMCLIVPPR